ncbi:ubiquitin protease cofactor [Gorgonomyces haynaldii]|nr:ubiquitin protease cofactor [Gorgonomyces haynaldii]
MTVEASRMSQAPKKVNPVEVGWLFVQQYYTFLNTSPERLHLFYNKSSMFIHGYEGETNTEASQGQQEIADQIQKLEFQDCKVLISSVDSQASSQGGVIIQVLGEMSNKGQPSHKFCQTFFLAEQPEGYYVLNDIFRFLREDIEDGFEQPEEKKKEVKPAPQKRAESPAKRPPPSPAPQAQPVQSVQPAPPVQQAPTQPAPAPPAQQNPSSWAAMASTSTGQPVVQPKPKKEEEQKPQRNAQRATEPPRKTEESRSVYVKNVSEGMEDELKKLFSRYGEVTLVDIPKGKGIAFIEFASHELAKAAIGQSVTANGVTFSAEERRKPQDRQNQNRNGQNNFPRERQGQPGFSRQNSASSRGGRGSYQGAPRGGKANN